MCITLRFNERRMKKFKITESLDLDVDTTSDSYLSTLLKLKEFSDEEVRQNPEDVDAKGFNDFLKRSIGVNELFKRSNNA